MRDEMEIKLNQNEFVSLNLKWGWFIMEYCECALFALWSLFVYVPFVHVSFILACTFVTWPRSSLNPVPHENFKWAINYTPQSEILNMQTLAFWSHEQNDMARRTWWWERKLQPNRRQTKAKVKDSLHYRDVQLTECGHLLSRFPRLVFKGCLSACGERLSVCALIKVFVSLS